MLSGAVLDASALVELIPDWRERGAPLDVPVTGDRLYLLTERGRIRSPFTPPPLRNHGCYVVSINRLAKWLTEQVESVGVDVFPGFAGAELLYDGDRVVGVRTGDRGDRPGRRAQVDVRTGRRHTGVGDGAGGRGTRQSDEDAGATIRAR